MAKRPKFKVSLEPRAFPPQRVGRAADLSTPPAVKLIAGCIKKGKGKSELVFAGREDADRLGIEPGPAVRLCTGEKARGKPRGHLVHVENVCQASAVARRWAECAKGAGGQEKLEACAREARSSAAACPREPYATLHGLGELGALPGALEQAWDRGAAKLGGKAKLGGFGRRGGRRRARKAHPKGHRKGRRKA